MHFLDTASILGLKLLKFLTVTVASAMIVGSSYIAWDMYHTEKSAFSSYDLSQYRPNVENGEPATLEEMEEINPDTKAWITIYDTHIDYPLTQGKDDLEYVNKNVYGKNAPTGSIYLTAQNYGDFSDPYNILYGHHMDNGAMFGDVSKFLEKDFFDKHTKGILITPDQVYDLELIGSVEDYAYNRIIYNPKATGLAILDFIKANAVHWRDPGKVIKVLGLSTCDDDRTNGRDLVFFKMSPHEGPYEYDIPDTKTPLRLGHGDYYWALLNLLCMIVTVYSFIPLHIILAKYRRKKKMKERNKLFEEDEDDPESVREKIRLWIEENGLDDLRGKYDDEFESFFNIKKFGRKATIGSLVELIIAVVSFIAFILTEDITLPIRIIDKWTPLMLALLFITWLIDVRLLRLKVEGEEEEEEDEYDNR